MILNNSSHSLSWCPVDRNKLLDYAVLVLLVVVLALTFDQERIIRLVLVRRRGRSWKRAYIVQLVTSNERVLAGR